MNPRWIDLESISCKGVRSFNLFQKPTIYAVVSLLDPSDQRHQEQKTPPDRTGGEKPAWDHPMRFNLDGQDGNGNGLLLEFNLMVQGNLLRDKSVGKARVPVSDLTADFAGSGFRHVSYQVRTSDGKANGVLSFAYKISYPEGKATAPAPTLNVDSMYPPVSAVDHFPPPPPPPEEPAVYYPPASPAVGLYPKLNRVDIYPPPDPAFNYYDAPMTGGYYPPPPPPPAYGAYYPPPTPMCCYPSPPDQHSYRAGSWDRGLYGYD